MEAILLGIYSFFVWLIFIKLKWLPWNTKTQVIVAIIPIIGLTVLILVPIAAIVVFWLVHILPEVIAEKRHHPQQESIKVLCLLSLVFGGMLWPIAWLWAYTRPVAYKMAYGTDKHEDYFVEVAEKARSGGMLREELKHLVEELEAMEARGALPAKLTGLKDELARLRAEATAALPAERPAATERAA